MIRGPVVRARPRTLPRTAALHARHATAARAIEVGGIVSLVVLAGAWIVVTLGLVYPDLPHALTSARVPPGAPDVVDRPAPPAGLRVGQYLGSAPAIPEARP